MSWKNVQSIPYNFCCGSSSSSASSWYQWLGEVYSSLLDEWWLSEKKRRELINYKQPSLSATLSDTNIEPCYRTELVPKEYIAEDLPTIWWKSSMRLGNELMQVNDTCWIAWIGYEPRIWYQFRTIRKNLARARNNCRKKQVILPLANKSIA